MSNFSITFVFVLLIQGWLRFAVCGSKVEFLPGFEGPLPFDLETGYVGVGKSDDVQLFYYFIKSQGDAKEDPLLLWLNGGPGCSVLSAIVYEIGPLYFEAAEYNGTLPRLTLNPNSWIQVANILFVDSPVGTGFSYGRNEVACQSGDFQHVEHLEQFLRKWLIDHPEFLSNPVYIGGESFCGIPVPPLVQRISDGNEEGSKPFVNLKGYLLGNAYTDYFFDGNSNISYAHGMGLISDELFQLLERTCGGEYVTIDPKNSDCLKHVEDFKKVTSGMNKAHILERNCVYASPKPNPINRSFSRRSLYLEYEDQFLNPDPSLPMFGCRTYGYLLSKYWANDKAVQKALHIREGSVKEWIRCNFGIPYKREIHSTVKYHLYLSNKGYRSLIYSGDHDMIVSLVGTEAWIKSLNFSIVEDWRPWLHEGQIAGFTRSYSSRMTFATIKGGGHTAPEYKPPECLAMFKRWINYEPL